MYGDKTRDKMEKVTSTGGESLSPAAECMARVVGSCRGRPGVVMMTAMMVMMGMMMTAIAMMVSVVMAELTMQQRLGARGAAHSLEKMRTTEDLVAGHLALP